MQVNAASVGFPIRGKDSSTIRHKLVLRTSAVGASSPTRIELWSFLTKSHTGYVREYRAMTNFYDFYFQK